MVLLVVFASIAVVYAFNSCCVALIFAINSSRNPYVEITRRFFNSDRRSTLIQDHAARDGHAEHLEHYESP